MADFSMYGGKSDEWLALEAQLPPEADMSPAQLKQTTNDIRLEEARQEMTLLSPKVHIQNFSIPVRDGTSIEARTYRPSSAPTSQKLPIFLYFHGGGFFFGTIGSEDATCSRIAIDVGVVVCNVNYRHTPEFVFPTAWHDSEDAFSWLYDHADEFDGDRLQVVIGGVSAGSWLTASLVLKLAVEEDDRRKGILGQVSTVFYILRNSCSSKT